jgi:hypothetical protein
MSDERELEKVKEAYRQWVKRKFDSGSNTGIGGIDPPPAISTGPRMQRSEAVQRFLKENDKTNPNWSMYERELEQLFKDSFPNGFPFA